MMVLCEEWTYEERATCSMDNNFAVPLRNNRVALALLSLQNRIRKLLFIKRMSHFSICLD